MSTKQLPVDQGSPDSPEQAARDARDHPALDWPARAGMVAYGVVYLLVAWLAAQLALGDPAGSASGEGALQEVAQKPLGSVVLWLAAAGLAALAVWEVCQAIGGHRSHDGARRGGARAGSAGRCLVFVVLAVLAARTATGSGGAGGSGGASGGGGSGGGGSGLTAELMRLPLGQALVVLVGLCIAAVGAYSVFKAVSGRWRQELEADGKTGTVGGVIAVLAKVGYVSRGAAFLVIGGLFVWAGLSHDPDKSGGLDQAIVRFRDESFGPWLMLVIAIGLACYGAYHFGRAWYLRGS